MAASKRLVDATIMQTMQLVFDLHEGFVERDEQFWTVRMRIDAMFLHMDDELARVSLVGALAVNFPKINVDSACI